MRVNRTLSILSAAALVTAGAAQADTLKANEQAAQGDAQRLMTTLRLPSGLRLVASGLTSADYSTRYRRRWATSASRASVIAFVRAHRPSGARLQSWSTLGSPLFLMYVWPALGTSVWNRTLTVTAASSTTGGTLVTAQAQSSWMVPRPASERVPASAHVIDVSLRIGTGTGGIGHQHTTTRVLTDAKKVAGLVREINLLPTVQPGVVMSCPALLPHEPLLTVLFRAAANRPPLARAQVNVYPGSHGASGWNECDAIDLWVRGHRQTPLTSRTWVKQVGTLIGANIS